MMAEALDEAPVGVAVLDEQLRFVYVNQMMADINGAAIEDHLGRRGPEVVPGVRDTVDPLLASVFEDGRTIRDVEFEAPKRDGEPPRWFRVTYVPMIAEQRRLVAAYCRDITSAKRAEQQLRHAAQRAERDNDHKTRMLAELSHEMRGPLAPVQSALETALAEPTISPELRDALRVGLSGVSQQVRLVDDLLDTNRAVRGKLSINRQPVDLRNMIREAVDAVDVRRRERRVNLSISQPDGPLIVHGDGDRLKQILWNLLTNAVKFTEPDGQVNVVIERHDEGGSDKLIIRTIDDGRGVDEADMLRLFSPFEQAEPASGGLGLGLALSRNLARLHGGELTLESPGRGRGAVATLTLPALPRMSVNATGNHKPLARLDGLRVLLVEDHFGTGRVTALLLRKMGAQVELANTLQAGVEAARRWRPGIILTDLNLPDGDGLTLPTLLAETDSLPERGMIALSGRDTGSIRRDAEQAGYAAYLLKPATSDAIAATLSRLAGR
jgi:two-component system CheB/CheR fusion protein